MTKEPTTAYTDRHPGAEDLHLVMEVADTSLTTELKVKALLYARAGIPQYLVLDLNKRQMIVHSTPSEGAYRQVTTHSEQDPVSPGQAWAAVIVGDLLPAPASSN